MAENVWAEDEMKRLYEDKRKCFGCGACVAACPEGAISMEADGEGFDYPRIAAHKCTGCGRCEQVCPAKAQPVHSKGRVYAVRCKDVRLLFDSTSGGAFSLLSQTVLAEGGLVCGAVFDKDFSVRHVLSREIGPMRKSKYVQSDLSGCYAAVGEALAAGHKVLFTGTPCQCHGMKRFFSEDGGKLILVSLICRGVQSPGLWRAYTAWLSRGGDLQAYDFRDKRRGDDGHTVSYTLDGRETVVSMGEDRLSRMYNQGLLSRPSCYTCPYARWDNDFDITMGDFWGVAEACPQLADGRGTSLVIARGERGEALIRQIKDEAQVIPCDVGTARQPALVGPAREPFLRKFLFRDYAGKAEGGCDIPLILKKYGGGAYRS